MKKRKWLWIGLAVILIAGVLLIHNPQIRTNLFVLIIAVISCSFFTIR